MFTITTAHLYDSIQLGFAVMSTLVFFYMYLYYKSRAKSLIKEVNKLDTSRCEKYKDSVVRSYGFINKYAKLCMQNAAMMMFLSWMNFVLTKENSGYFWWVIFVILHTVVDMTMIMVIWLLWDVCTDSISTSKKFMKSIGELNALCQTSPV